MAATERINRELAAAGLRVHVDRRKHLTPGFKFNDWELRGVPARLEIGPKDVAKNSVALSRRDVPGREGKQFVSQDGLPATVQSLLESIHQNMLEKARQFREKNTYEPRDYAEFQEVVQNGFARVWWAGTSEDERRIKEETRATIRCFPNEQPGGAGACFYTGKPAGRIAIFARAY